MANVHMASFIGLGFIRLSKSPLPVLASRRAATAREGLEQSLESSLGGSANLIRRSAGEVM